MRPRHLIFAPLVCVTLIACQQSDFAAGTRNSVKDKTMKDKTGPDDDIEDEIPTGTDKKNKKMPNNEYGDPIAVTADDFETRDTTPYLDPNGKQVSTKAGQPVFIDKDKDILIYIGSDDDVATDSVSTSDPFDDPGSEITFEDDGISYKKTKTIAVVFEDSFKEKNWKQRDIRICVKGRFGFNSDTNVIKGASKTTSVIEVNAYKNPTAACSHKFKVEVLKKDGSVKSDETFDTAANDNFNKSTVKLEFGETLNLSWTRISGDICFTGPILHTSSQVPKPKIFTENCGDFSP